MAYCRETFNILHLVSDTPRPLRVTDSLPYLLFSFPLPRSQCIVFLSVLLFLCDAHTFRRSSDAAHYTFAHPRVSYFSESRATTQGNTSFSRSLILSYIAGRLKQTRAVMKSASRYLCIGIYVMGLCVALSRV